MHVGEHGASLAGRRTPQASARGRRTQGVPVAGAHPGDGAAQGPLGVEAGGPGPAHEGEQLGAQGGLVAPAGVAVVGSGVAGAVAGVGVAGQGA